MRPQLRSASRNTVLGLSAALALVVAARIAGARVVSDRCIAAARAMPIAGGRTVGDALSGGAWQIGARDAAGSRPISYRRGGDVWEWSCLDETSRPGFIAISAPARALTPERYFGDNATVQRSP